MFDLFEEVFYKPEELILRDSQSVLYVIHQYPKTIVEAALLFAIVSICSFSSLSSPALVSVLALTLKLSIPLQSLSSR